jgi:D-sedoheptulose 7-phosphate isomerase
VMQEDGTLLAPVTAVPPESPAILFYDAVTQSLAGRRAAIDTALSRMLAGASPLAAAAARLVDTLRSGHKVLVAGNGGSAAEAQHFAAELVGRFKRERAAYAVMSLTTDTSILTAVANDYGYADVFARQVAAFGHPGDLLLAYSTSGESDNLLRAADVAHARGMTVVAVTGSNPSRLSRAADLALRMPLTDTPLVQELHMAVTHILCDIAECQLAGDEERVRRIGRDGHEGAAH